MRVKINKSIKLLLIALLLLPCAVGNMFMYSIIVTISSSLHFAIAIFVSYLLALGQYDLIGYLLERINK